MFYPLNYKGVRRVGRVSTLSYGGLLLRYLTIWCLHRVARYSSGRSGAGWESWSRIIFSPSLGNFRYPRPKRLFQSGEPTRGLACWLGIRSVFLLSQGANEKYKKTLVFFHLCGMGESNSPPQFGKLLFYR